MALVECEKGHVYDDEKFPACPYCMNSWKQKGIYISVTKKKERRRFYIAGWLVETEGREKGKDFQIYAGKNRINQDVCIVYDPRGNQFYAVPETGKTVYLNGELLMKPAVIRTEDRIACGEEIYEFVAFCRGKKRWK